MISQSTIKPFSILAHIHLRKPILDLQRKTNHSDENVGETVCVSPRQREHRSG